MNSYLYRRSAAVTALLFMLMLTGCVHYGQFRDGKCSNPSCQPIFYPEGERKYYLGFVEFDDFGELYDRGQLNKVMTMIQNAKKASKNNNAIVITFIHGWKNNASDNTGNVWGFREELADISREFPNQSVVGVYIGWRGAVTNVPVVKELTFFDRRNAAIRIPGAHLTETLDRIMSETKSCIEHCSENQPPGTGSLAIIVGHSFGGMVLERTLTQSVVGDILKQEADRKEAMRRWIDLRSKGQATEAEKPVNNLVPPADLITMVNEAAPATEGKQLLDLLKKHKMKLKVRASDGEDLEQPLFLSITSTGDVATGLAMPLGQYPSKITKSMRRYQNPDPPEIPNQSTYYLHTTAHLPPLFSHWIGKEQDEKISKAKAEAPTKSRCFASEHLPDRYCIVPVPKRYNDTPYWVMQMPTEFVPDHSTIFRPVFRDLLKQFILERMTPEGVRKPAVIQLAEAEPEPAAPEPPR